MAQEIDMSFADRLALDMYLRYKFCDTENRPIVDLVTPEWGELVPDAQGGWYRKEDGTVGEYYQEIVIPHQLRQQERARPRYINNATTIWREQTGEFTVTRTPLEPTPAPDNPEPLPQVERFRLLTSMDGRLIKTFKKMAKDVLENL